MSRSFRDKERFTSVGATAIILSQLAFPGAVSAQEAALSQDNGDIIVTARAREESLYKAPLSITSLGSQEISDANLRDISDLAQVAPGFHYTPQVTFSSSRVTPAIRFRGMTIPRNDPLEQLGGVFVDGVYLFGGAQSLTFDDIQRVEVIKGPQSALFGRGTFSGAINFITREPADTLRARVAAGVETRGTYNFNGSLEGPLTDTLSFRLSGAVSEKGGHHTATDGGELGREHSDVLNAQLVWKPVDGLRFRLRHSEVWMDDSRNATVNLNPQRPELIDAPGRCITGTAPFWCGALPDYDQLRPGAVSGATSLIPPSFADSNNPSIIIDVLRNNKSNPLVVNGLPFIDKTPSLDHSGLAGRFTRTSFEAENEFDNGMTMALALSSSRMASTTAQASTDDHGNQYVVSTNIMTDKSIDFRFSSDASKPFTWLVGANYFVQRSVGGLSGTGGLISVLDATKRVSYTEPTTYSGQGEVEYYSGFFGLHYDMADWIAFDVEGRYQVDKTTTSYGLPTEIASTYKSFQPRAIVTLSPTENLTVYGSWARGAMRGTTNSNFELLSPALQAEIAAIPGYTFKVPAETVDSFEIGIKQGAGPIRFALAGYYMNWQNLKNTVNTPCPGNLCGPGLPGRFAPAVIPAEADIWGLEGDVNWRISRTWSLAADFGLVHARYGQMLTPLTQAPTGQVDATGKVPVGFPEKQATFSSSYRNDVTLFGNDWQWYTRAEVNYTGRIYVDEINQSWLDPKARVNLRFGVEQGGARIELYGENLFNDKTFVSAVRGSASNFRVGPASVSQPTAFAVLPRLRTFGIRSSYQF